MRLEFVELGIEELIDLLENTVVNFIYKKSDGSLRFATGTRSNNLIPPSKEKFELYERTLKDIHEIGSCDHQILTLNEMFPEGDKKQRKQNPDRVNYYDFSCGGWRNFSKDKLVGYYEIVK